MRDPANRLVVTGKTNLPPHLLGLNSIAPQPVAGYTGWRWQEGSPFANDGLGADVRQRLQGPPSHRKSNRRKAAACWPTCSNSAAT